MQKIFSQNVVTYCHVRDPICYNSLLNIFVNGHEQFLRLFLFIVLIIFISLSVLFLSKSSFKEKFSAVKKILAEHDILHLTSRIYRNQKKQKKLNWK